MLGGCIYMKKYIIKILEDYSFLNIKYEDLEKYINEEKEKLKLLKLIIRQVYLKRQ